MKIALSGATGLVGSRFYDVFKNKYEIIPISSSFNVDITDKKKITKFLTAKNPAIIIHLAAKTHVDACEEDKLDDLKKMKSLKLYKDDEVILEDIDPEEWKGSKSAFGINVVGTKNLADYAHSKGIRIVYISTDFIFDGHKGDYTEEDSPAPVDWYGQTKYYGEKVLGQESLVARIAFPYGFRSNIKSDLIWTLVNLLSKNDSVKLISDQIITPTFIEDIVRGIDFLIERRELGVVNLVGNDFLSPSEIGVAVAREFGFDETKIDLTTREELYKGRAPRPFKVTMKNDKLKSLGFVMTNFFEALTLIKNTR